LDRGSAINDPAVKAVRADSEAYSLETGVTIFVPDATAEESLLSILEAVELHHGEYSHDPPVSVIEVVGADTSVAVLEHLAAYGFVRVEPASDGFTAHRPA
jgi:hypothetical protein